MAEEVYESDLINMVIGTHMSIAKGIVKTAENVVKMNADTMQIFSRNPRGSNYKDPTVKEAEEFQRIRRAESNPRRGITSGADRNLSGYLSCVCSRI